MQIEEIFKKAQTSRDNNQIPEAITYYHEALDFATSAGDFWYAAEASHMMGICFKITGDYTAAKMYFEEAKKKFEGLGDIAMMGAVLRDLADLSYEQKDYESAKKTLLESIEILKKTDRIGHLGISKAKLGLVEAESGDLERGESLVREGLTDIQKSDDWFFKTTALLHLAQIQSEKEEKDAAKESLESALKILNSHGGENEYQIRRKQIADALSDIES